MVTTPLTTFNFLVELTREDEGKPMCEAAFAECDGLEVTMQPKTYQEGGNNGRQIQLAGPVTYGQLSLKRGMTDSVELWKWFDETMAGNYSLRANGVVSILSPDRGRVTARFLLSRCLPIKLKAPGLNAKDGQLAIEEMHIAYERMQIDTNPQ